MVRAQAEAAKFNAVGLNQKLVSALKEIAGGMPAEQPVDRAYAMQMRAARALRDAGITL